MDINRQEGALTIEASVTFTIFMFLIIFFLNFGKLYIAQNIVNHATLQTAKNLSVRSFYSEAAMGSKTGVLIQNSSAYISFFTHLLGQGTVPQIIFDSLDVDNEEGIARDEFKNVISADGQIHNVDAYLRWCGVENGLSGISFKGSKMKWKDYVYVRVGYEVEMSCPIIGNRKIKICQTGKVKRFGEEN